MCTGDSISTGYGNECPASALKKYDPKMENAYQSYGAMTARALSAELRIAAWGGKGICKNFDQTQGNTMPVIWGKVLPRWAPAVDWNFSAWQPHVVVVNLGVNDFTSELFYPSQLV